MATYVSTNMEGFHKDISSKTKTRENVAPLWAGSFGERRRLRFSKPYSFLSLYPQYSRLLRSVVKSRVMYDHLQSTSSRLEVILKEGTYPLCMM